MKATGIVRRVDDLGRVQIPNSLRREMQIHPGDVLEIFTEGQNTICFYNCSTHLLDRLHAFSEIIDETYTGNNKNEVIETLNKVAMLMMKGEE